MGGQGLGDCRGQGFPLAGTTTGSATAALIRKIVPSEMKRFAAGDQSHAV